MGAEAKIKTRAQVKVKLLIADDDRPQSRRLVDFFKQNGFDARAVYGGRELKASLINWRPDLVLCDLLLPQMNAFQLLRFVKDEPMVARQNMGVIVTSSHKDPENLDESFKRGARDFIVRPYLYQDLLNRVVLQCRDPREIKPLTDQDVAAHWHLVDLILAQSLKKQSIEEALYSITQMLAKKLGGVRCSVIRTSTMSEGVVIASSDSADIAGLKLDLIKYPEVQLVVNTKKTVAIDNLSQSRALSGIKKALKDVSFNSMIVCPLYYNGHTFGVISMRMPETKKTLSDDDVRFMDMCSKIISLTLKSRNVEELSKWGLIPAA